MAKQENKGKKGKINLRLTSKLIKISPHLYTCMSVYESIQPFVGQFVRPTICRSVGTTLVAVVSYVVYA